MSLKRLLSALCTVCLLVCAFPFCAAADSQTISVASVNSPRNDGELVIFTDEYDDSTGTNWWGAEALVDENHCVIELGSGNSDIPAGGFVVSGHDDETEGGSMMKTWVRDHIRVGDYVYFDRRTMTLTVSDVPLEIDLSPFFTVSRGYDATNDTRHEDQLIIYDFLRGSSSQTNAHGYEVVVDESGAIVSMGGNDNAIPKNGYVVSGHGRAADWLRAQVILGMRAELDRDAKTITFAYDEQSLRAAVQNAMTEAEAAIVDAKAHFVYADYAAAEASIAAAKATFEAGAESDAAFADLCDETLEALSLVKASLCDSVPVQYRGVWVRPDQRTPQEVDDYIKELSEAGVNTVSVEGFFDNSYIFELPEDYPMVRNPRFNFDVLQAYIDACHKYDMECHLWMPIMNVGYANEKGYDNTIAAHHPEWLSLSHQGSSDNPNGFHMIDPANEEARAYLVDFYKYLVTTYDIDGFELDYIRYYDRGELDFGYTQAAFDGFEAAYGHGVTPEYESSADYWNDWLQYRRDRVTQMVIAVSNMIRKEAPGVIIAADTAPTEDNDLNQEYLRWVNEGYIDVLHQMAYGDGFGPEITKAVQAAGDHALIVPALTTLSASMMERQAREDQSYRTYGEYFFEAKAFLAAKAPEALATTVYREKALAPFLDPDASVKALLSYMAQRIDNVILPLEGMSDAEADAVKAALSTAGEAVASGVIEPSALEALRTAINALENKAAAKALTEDLYRAEQIGFILQKNVTDTHTSTPDGANATTDFDPTWWIVGGAAVLAIAVSVIWLMHHAKESNATAKENKTEE